MTEHMMMDAAEPQAIARGLSQQHPGLFLTMVEQAPIAISLTDAEARIIYANPAFCRQTGYALDELLQQNPRLLASKQTPRIIYDDMWRTLHLRQPWRGQLINRRRDGSLFLVEIDITPVINACGELEHYLAMQRDISTGYALEQRLRNQMTLTEAVLNNIPAAVVVVDEQDQVVMDNLTYKTLCADCGGKELLTELDFSRRKKEFAEGAVIPVMLCGAVRWLRVNCWTLPGVSEEASRYFVDNSLTRTLVVITDHTQQQQQQEQGRLDRLKQHMTSGKLLAAIRDSLDAALIQLNCPINMLAAARRLNGTDHSNVALDSAWHEGEEAMARLQRCRPSLDLEHAALWSLHDFFADLRALYHTRYQQGDSLEVTQDSPHLVCFGQRTQILACLSLWLDRTLDLAAGLPAFSLQTQIYAHEEEGWLAFYLCDNVPLRHVQYTHAPDALNAPGKGMELRLIQTLVAHHHGAIELTSPSEGGSCLTLRFPLFASLTGGSK
ncbi:nitrogen fixation negative regulator NifL [Pantoea cypripedii]|uniref:Nitrogen fixation negative regulator NifL n=1 Tax=Pantoea cypripedii TaxID=55209 RepID=A0A1X1EK74_PANCY|nr:nitrogen fixation negative regulator NifL [Pantoea cypripedii]MBP2198887.1 PAS domain S-box-containing protein [Pantoea cypripedii]ORM89331.1 nitrogen fixation negative regulator NifL [Pantoea cypripedii]